MIKVVFSPSWFMGIDNIFELITIIVTLLIAIYSWKVYKFSKESIHKYFSYAFFMISLSYIIKILMDISIYYPTTKIVQVGLLTVITHTFQKLDIFYTVGFFVSRLLLMLGMVGIFLVLERKGDKYYAFLLVYLAFVAALFGNFLFHIFHITTALLLLLIFIHYYNNYVECRSRNVLLVALSFLLIFISQIIFITVQLHPVLYVVAESVQLLGYLILLYLFISILRK
ncbi:MAG: hypothetical protein V1645_00890 [archaeon]